MASATQSPRLVLAQCRLHHPHPPPQPRRLLHSPHAAAATAPSSSSSSPPSSEILSIRESLLSRRKKATEVASDYLRRLRGAEPTMRSFLHVAEAEEVLRQAEEVDKAVEKGEELGPLAGVLVGVKDNLCTADMPSTGGSRILEGYRPAFDATAVRKLREKGAIVVGKTNLDEFGMGSSTERSAFQEVPDYVPKLISTDHMDSKPLKGIRIGVIRDTLGEGVDVGVISSIQAAAAHLEDLGAVVTEASLPSFSLGLPAYYILASSESSSNLSRYDGIRYGNQVPADELISLYGNSRANGFGSEVKMRILMGTYALSAGYYDAYYKRAQQVRTLVRKSFKDALDQNDVLISPAAPSAAYKIGEKIDDPLAMYAGDIMTVNVNLAGLPALVVPCGFVGGVPSGLPVGLQMIGAAFEEGKLFRVGHIFEQTLKNYRFVPPAFTES